ncbi:hypothetical protein [Rhizobium leguminosarum]|uniref:hypothetical protein n=1 Tax=Rhizobium leguminosarum TaxID=384 RepID=UPI000413E020|nr:hypothetical protein [Rhizobium leguminosarum]
MDLHIGELTSEIEVADQSGSLRSDQIEQIVAIVVARLEQRERQRRMKSESMSVNPGFLSRLPWE